MSNPHQRDTHPTPPEGALPQRIPGMTLHPRLATSHNPSQHHDDGPNLWFQPSQRHPSGTTPAPRANQDHRRP